MPEAMSRGHDRMSERDNSMSETEAGYVNEEVGVDQADLEEGVAASREPTPGDLLRSLPTEAHERGTRFVSAQAMQARLFSVAATAAEDALALVQQQLTLTLNRSYYEADEIETMADRLDSLLTLDLIDLSESDLVSDE
jgi:hypothetical protein